LKQPQIFFTNNHIKLHENVEYKLIKALKNYDDKFNY